MTAESATPWIPLGESAWEFGVDKKIRQKADDAYSTRTDKVPPDVCARTTFVFVTPRDWRGNGKQDWLAAKRAEKRWRDVRALDANDLEQWLETSIPAQAWLAEQLPLGDRDILDLDGCWRRWAEVTDPVMSKVLFRATTEFAARKLATWLDRPAESPFTVVAESDDEALAALACVFEAEPLAQRHTGDRVVVVRSASAMTKVASASSSFIVILASAEGEAESAGLHRRQHTIVVTYRNRVEDQPDLTVDLVDDATFRAGLEDMGFTHGHFERLERESGRSLTVLRRRLAQLPALRLPPWADQKLISDRLIPLMLVGAWDASSPADQAVLAGIAASLYEDIEKTVAELVGEPHSPLWSIGHMRGVASKTDVSYAVRRLVTVADLRRFFHVARIVLSEEDPALELPEEKRWLSNLYGKSRRHSGALRQGICETLVLLSVHGDNLFRARLGFNVTAEVNHLIRELLTPLEGSTWQSQQHDLPRYAEAAPDLFLDLLDQDLRSEEPKVYALMQPAQAGLFSSPGRTGLLWALEALAWNPQWLFRVVAILGKLAELKLSDHWMNRPENSLESIFRCWMPQTAAPIEKRIEALDLLIRTNMAVGWRICLNQFDIRSTVGDYNVKPRWRADASGAGEPVSTYEAHQMARRALDLAIAWPDHDENTLGDLVERLEGIPDDQDAVWAAVQAWLRTQPSDAAKAALRERIRRFTMVRLPRRHRDDASPVSPEARKVFDALQPEDLIWRHKWLFAQHWVQESADELGDALLDFDKREERIGRRRNDTLREIWSATGFAGIRRLCSVSEAPRVIGAHLAKVLEVDEATTFALTVVKAEFDNQLLGCLSGLLSALSTEVRNRVMETALRDQSANCREAAVDRLLQCAPFTSETWARLDAYPKMHRDRYWAQVAQPRLLTSQSGEANEVVDELLRVARPRAAFNTVETVLEAVSSDRLLRLLHEAGTRDAEPAGCYMLSSHYISRAFEILSARDDTEENSLAQLEFLYVDVLRDTTHGIRNLERQLSASPALFVQALAYAFKRCDDREDPLELRPKELAPGLADAAYSLLSRAKRLPGTNDNGELDPRKLRDWIGEVRALTRQYIPARRWVTSESASC